MTTSRLDEIAQKLGFASVEDALLREFSLFDNDDKQVLEGLLPELSKEKKAVADTTAETGDVNGTKRVTT